MTVPLIAEIAVVTHISHYKYENYSKNVQWFLGDDHLMFIVLVSVATWTGNETGKI